MSNGYIYILFNEMYQFYGPNVYKVGKTNDISKRTSGYTTSYIEPVEIKFLSKEVKNYTLAEQLTFKLLKKDRIKQNREFFKIDNIKDTIYSIELIIEKINKMTDEEINKKIELNFKDKIQDKRNEIKKGKDELQNIIELFKQKTENDKILYLEKFENFYNIDRLDINLKTSKFNLQMMNDEEFKIYKNVFKSIKEQPKTKEQLGQMYNGFIKNIIGTNEFIKYKKARNKNKQIYIYFFKISILDRIKERIEAENFENLVNKPLLFECFKTETLN